jgi:hypothetical protein
VHVESVVPGIFKVAARYGPVESLDRCVARVMHETWAGGAPTSASRYCALPDDRCMLP